MAQEKQVLLYLSIDDTVIEKKKPSSRATRTMEGTGWHYSHLEGKQVFDYQVFCTNISVGDVSLYYCLCRCRSESGSKIDMALQLLDKLPETDARVILQMDKWYTRKVLWDKALKKNITLIDAMKTTVFFTLTATATAPRITLPCSQTTNTILLQREVTSTRFIAMKGRSMTSKRQLFFSPVPKTHLAARKRSASLLAPTWTFPLTKFLPTIHTAGKLNLCSSNIKCIWVSNPLWSALLKRLTVFLSSFP